MADVAPTRTAALELAAEKQLMRQGFSFLDEKRMLLAAEILRVLKRYEAAAEDMTRRRIVARSALARAVERHGLDALQLYPSPAREPAPPVVETVKFIGASLREMADWRAEIGPSETSVDPSAESETCRKAFADWLETAALAGTLAGNLERLGREYRRVERRAKALENVLMPEVDASLKRVQEQLDVLDLEEAVRVRLAGARG